MLHITNGDCAVEALARAGIARHDMLPWRDVLHEGPVPDGLTLNELSAVRARFLSACGCGDEDALRESFSERDFRLAGAQAEDEVVLWFESDVYDQLQLLQLLDWFAAPSHRPSRLTIIEVDRSPVDGRFEGLGGIDPERVRGLLTSRQPVMQAALDAAVTGWRAFRRDDPRSFAALLDEARNDPEGRRGVAGRAPCADDDIDALPYLREAMARLLEELPDSAYGLSRTELQALQLLSAGAQTRETLFARVQEAEPRPFLGDTWFWRLLDRLSAGRTPLLRRGGSGAPASVPLCPQLWTLTDAGHEVLSGRLDALEALGIDRWWGGTRLWHRGKIWRWNGAALAVDEAGIV
jgi:hypothetical protein